MTSQKPGDLVKDQKTGGIFQVYGFSIAVRKDGRRMWSRKFKQHVSERILSGALTENEVQKTCDVSRKTTDKWRRELQANSARKRKIQTQKFVEVELEPEPNADQNGVNLIALNWRGVELALHADYPVGRLVELVRQLGSPQ